jgi:hypothetical protein
MSTEHQQYSPENELEIIRQWATDRNVEIVQAYSDHRRSGLNISCARLIQRFQFHDHEGDQARGLFTAWLELPDGQRNAMNAEFRDIFEMSCESGFRAILDEAEWHLTAGSQAYTEFVDKLAVDGDPLPISVS